MSDGSTTPLPSPTAAGGLPPGVIPVDPGVYGLPGGPTGPPSPMPPPPPPPASHRHLHPFGPANRGPGPSDLKLPKGVTIATSTGKLTKVPYSPSAVAQAIHEAVTEAGQGTTPVVATVTVSDTSPATQ